MKRSSALLPLLLLPLLGSGLGACSCSREEGTPTAPAATIPPGGGAEDITAEVWADNWFSMYAGGVLVGEDSVPITTERSFNAETFTFSAERPFVLATMMKDFKEDDTGLEYIGENNQQMGDGGFIAQLKSASGGLIAVSDSEWVCLVIHTAPLNKDCEKDSNPSETCQFESLEEPDGWADPDFDDSAWTAATEYSEADVSPKDGYDEIAWNPGAKLIWGDDLETNNTILCRVLVD